MEGNAWEKQGDVMMRLSLKKELRAVSSNVIFPLNEAAKSVGLTNQTKVREGLALRQSHSVADVSRQTIKNKQFTGRQLFYSIPGLENKQCS